MIVVGGSEPDNQEIANGVADKLRITIYPPYIAYGFFTSDRRPLAAVVFNDYTGSNIEMTIVAERGGITRGVLRFIGDYVFCQLGCRRLTVRAKKENKKVKKLALRYGFKYEHVIGKYFPDDDAVLFRMMRDECKWIDHEITKPA